MINPRNAINFFKTPAGAFILFCLVLGGIFFACKRFLPGETKPQPLVYSTKAAAAAASKQTMQTFQNTNYSPLPNHPPPTAMMDMTSQPESARQSNHAPAKQEVLPISLFAESPQAEQKQLGKNYAPFGRLIPCELIVAVDSSSIQTPIIGLVTEDIYHNGRLIIPAGTEVHGKAQTDRIRSDIRRFKEAIPMLNERIENLKLDMAQRTDTRGDAFQIVLEKSVIKDRAIAGELLSRITRRVANANNQFEIGAFGGFQLFARSSLWGKVELVLHGENHYALNVAETPLGMIRSLEYLVQNLEERMAYNQRDLADSEKKYGELETKIGQPFEHESKLQSLAQRQQQLEDALDITKNQAANSLSTEEAGQATEPETESVKKTIRQSHGKSATEKNGAKMRVSMAH